MKQLDFVKCLVIICMLFTGIIFAGFFECSFAVQQLDDVVITSNSHSDPDSLTTISITWSYATQNSIDGYYYTLSTLSDYTIVATDEMLNNTADEVNLTASDGTYYFYIAPYKSFPPPLILGSTTKEGPIVVDTTSPGNISVNGPETTETDLISLTIGADEVIDQVCVSESTYGTCGWEDFESPNHEYSLKSGLGQYLLKVQVKDIAGNIGQASPFAITYTTSDQITLATYTSVPTLTEWGFFIFFGMLLMIALISIRRPLSFIYRN